MKIKYVVGFMFSSDFKLIALIRKNKPKWQAGLLNGIGGKVEQNENSHYAMAREFKEEAGIWIPCWVNFCSMHGTNNDKSQFEIEFYFVIGNPIGLMSQESEEIKTFESDRICAGAEKTIGNLPWLVALAIDFGKGVHPPKKVTAEY